jgi:sec-independent protein translocase protein TatA
MLADLFSGWHLIVILAIVVLLFGATRLPGVAKAIGQSMRIFKKEVKTMKEENPVEEAPATDSLTEKAPQATSQPKP